MLGWVSGILPGASLPFAGGARSYKPLQNVAAGVFIGDPFDVTSLSAGISYNEIIVIYLKCESAPLWNKFTNLISVNDIFFGDRCYSLFKEEMQASNDSCRILGKEVVAKGPYIAFVASSIFSIGKFMADADLSFSDICFHASFMMGKTSYSPTPSSRILTMCKKRATLTSHTASDASSPGAIRAKE